MKDSRILFVAMVLITAMLACAVPGLPAGSTPAPEVRPGKLETMVAETVAAAIVQTRRAAPTLTPAPLSINSPEPTSTLMQDTPTAEPAASSASSLTAQGDGTILYVDSKAGFQLNVSPGWLPVRINEQEYYDAFSLPAAAQPAVQRTLMNIKTLDPNKFRLFIYDFQDGHMVNGVITNINFVWDAGGSIALEDEAGIKKAAQELAKSIPSLKVQSYSVSSTVNNLPIGVILSEIPGKTFEGMDVVLYQKQVYLNLPGGELIISFTTEQGFKDATVSFFETMVDSLKLLN